MYVQILRRASLSLVWVALIALLFTSNALGQQHCLKLAWDAYNEGRYQDTINHTNVCFQRFRKPARDIQCKLEEGDWVPPIGGTSDTTKVFNLGLLNDVATSYFLKGMSAEFLWKDNKADTLKTMALEAFETVCSSYTYGRAWDKQGWFWSPCKSSCYESQLLDELGTAPAFCNNEKSTVACN